MGTTLALALAVPGAVAAARLAGRTRLPRIVADAAGIALQTVIIIVVLLVIAGGVAGVLLSQGTDAIGQLEASGVETEITVDNCATTFLFGDSDGGTLATTVSCTFAGPNVSEAGCRAVKGTNASAAADMSKSPPECTITF